MTDKKWEEILRIRMGGENEGLSNTAFTHLGYAKNKLSFLNETGIPQKRIMLSDGTQVTLKAEQDNQRIRIVTPERGGLPQRFWKDVQISEIIEPLPVIVVTGPRLYTEILLPFIEFRFFYYESVIGYIINTDKFQTFGGTYYDKDDVEVAVPPQKPSDLTLLTEKPTRIIIKTDPVVDKTIGEVTTWEPDTIKTGYEFRELEEFSDEERTSRGLSMLLSSDAGPGANVLSTWRLRISDGASTWSWVYWEATVLGSDFPSEPQLENTDQWSWPASSLGAIYKFPYGSDNPEPFFVYRTSWGYPDGPLTGEHPQPYVTYGYVFRGENFFINVPYDPELNAPYPTGLTFPLSYDGGQMSAIPGLNQEEAGAYGIMSAVQRITRNYRVTVREIF